MFQGCFKGVSRTLWKFHECFEIVSRMFKAYRKSFNKIFGVVVVVVAASRAEGGLVIDLIDICHIVGDSKRSFDASTVYHCCRYFCCF